MYIGSGETTFTEYRGNFDVDDYVTQRIPLNNFTLDGTTVTLRASSDETAQVSPN